MSISITIFIVAGFLASFNSYTCDLFPKCGSTSSKNLILNTKYGRVRGSCHNVLINYPLLPRQTRQVMSWRGIPFAEPPVGKLRFRAPVKKQPWSSVHDGTRWSNMCIQANSDNGDFTNKTLESKVSFKIL